MQSNRLNYQQLKFVFSAVLTPLKNANILLTFDEPVYFYFRTGGLSIDSIRNLLKAFDEEYPISNDRKQSYGKLTSAEMSKHIQFIELKSSEAGYTLPYINEEWERLMAQIRN